MSEMSKYEKGMSIFYQVMAIQVQYDANKIKSNWNALLDEIPNFSKSFDEKLSLVPVKLQNLFEHEVVGFDAFIHSCNELYFALKPKPFAVLYLGVEKLCMVVNHSTFDMWSHYQCFNYLFNPRPLKTIQLPLLVAEECDFEVQAPVKFQFTKNKKDSINQLKRIKVDKDKILKFTKAKKISLHSFLYFVLLKALTKTIPKEGTNFVLQCVADQRKFLNVDGIGLFIEPIQFHLTVDDLKFSDSSLTKIQKQLTEIEINHEQFKHFRAVYKEQNPSSLYLSSAPQRFKLEFEVEEIGLISQCLFKAPDPMLLCSFLNQNDQIGVLQVMSIAIDEDELDLITKAVSEEIQQLLVE